MKIDKDEFYISFFIFILCLSVGLVLVSDAIAALGLLPGKHKLGTIEVEISENMVTVAGQKTLAGRLYFSDNNLSFFQAKYVIKVSCL